MATITPIWTLFGIILLHYNALATDQLDAKMEVTNKIDFAKDNPFSHIDDTLLESVLDKDASSGNDIDDGIIKESEHKRNIGRWRNANWAYGGGKRNFGRWKNRNWSNGRIQNLPDVLGRDNIDGHSIYKRFSEGFGDTGDSDLDGLVLVPGDFYEPGYLEDLQTKYPYSNSVKGYMDKRQASRWNLIHRKMMQLDRDGKRSLDTLDKRSPSRWRLIQQKLNQLERDNNNQEKRFVGRWKNQNWLLGKNLPKQ